MIATASFRSGDTTVLRRRIERMAERWRYSTTELAEVLKLARQAPAKWELAVTLDEQLCERMKAGEQ